MRGLILGAIAGAAGTMALDVAGYADMAIRGRTPSDLPAEVIRRLAARAGMTALSIPSEEAGDATKNRRTALGAISGYKIGTLIGALYGAIAYRNPRFGTVRAVVLGAIAMAASDVPSALLGATDVADWTVDSWISDIAPHLAYGIVTAAAFAAMAGEA
jgi:hypothetical protein